ncbi:MAG TPA: DUF4388 domain-containing protein, partial [Polyangia bacterium]|nr:DUF4388 domain-containing protein [Polyangia bacterium]
MGGYVLIVERDPDLQRQMVETLLEAGYECGSEADVAWAARSVAARPPDAIIIGDPAGAGADAGNDNDASPFRLASDLRRHAAAREVPIVFVASRLRGASHRAEARRRFVPAAYLDPPLDRAELLAVLDRLSAPLRAPPAAAIPRAALPPDPEQQREGRDVERQARQLHTGPGLRGTLRRTPLAHLLQRLYAERASGSLLLSRDETKKIVGFVDGYPVAVRSNVRAECLGQILLSQQMISPAALAASVTRMRQERRRQGEILVEMGALSPYNLERALAEQVVAKLYEIFSWTDGNFMFKEGLPAGDDQPIIDRPPAALILEGIRRHYDGARLDAVLATLAHHRLRLSPDPVLRLQEMTSDPLERAFIRAIDEQARKSGARLPAILNDAALGRDKARVLVVALAEAGMLEAMDGSTRGRTAPGGWRVAPTPAPAAVENVGSGPYEGVQLGLVAMALRTQSPAWALGVETGASPAEIDRAYETLARRFHADRYRHASEDDRRTAREIFDRLAEAYHSLRGPGRRGGPSSRAAPGTEASDKARSPSARRDGSDSPPSGAGSGNPAGAPSPAAAAVRAIYDAGMEHLRARRHHEAVEAFRQAARLLPGEADYRAALGWALFREAPADARAG